MISLDAIGDLVRREWDLGAIDLIAHHGGMNSSTWWVEVDGVRRWVAKSVPATNRDDFVGGLAVAGRLQAGGIPAGAPLPARDGITALLPDGSPIALLEYVDGDELTEDDGVEIGATLGRAHRILGAVRLAAAHPFHRIDLEKPYMGVRGWIRPTVAAVLQNSDAAGLTCGLLHTDPAPEAFRINRESSVIGLIDWSVAMSGPLMYDVASAVMYVGGPDHRAPLLDAYLDTGALTAREVERGLMPMLRYRAAIQAMYFAYRVFHNDLTGIADEQENEKGLSDARGMLAEWA